jgi:hypothetical protein
VVIGLGAELVAIVIDGGEPLLFADDTEILSDDNSRSSVGRDR